MIFSGLLFYSRLCDFTISLAFKNSVRHGVLQNNLLQTLACVYLQFCFFVISNKFCSKDHKAFHQQTCEGVVSLISHVSFFPYKWYPQDCYCLVPSGSALLQRNENIALLKAQKAKLQHQDSRLQNWLTFCFILLS